MAEVFDHVAIELYFAREAVLAGSQQAETPLDELIPFQRSEVTQLDSDEYRPGPTGEGLGGFVDEFAREMGLVRRTPSGWTRNELVDILNRPVGRNRQRSRAAPPRSSRRPGISAQPATRSFCGLERLLDASTRRGPSRVAPTLL